MAATTEDLARLLVSIEFTQKQSEKQLAAIAKRAGQTAESIEGRFQKANDNVGKSFDAASKKSVASVGAQRAAISNLSFQLNDIATSLSGGASPFTVMMQQGSQVAQALSSTGGGLSGVVKTLGGAFASLANPVSIASFAIIGLTGYAVQYFSELLSGGEKSEKVLKEEAELIDRVAQKWGEALPTLKKYNDERNRLKDQADLTNAAEAVAQGQYEPIRKVIGDVRAEIGALVVDLRQAGTEDEDILKLQDSFNGLYEKVEAGKASTSQLREVQANLAAIFKATGIPAAEAMAASIGKVADELDRAIEAADGARFEAAIQDFFKRSPIGTLTPLVAGGGQFLNPDQQQTFNANSAVYQQAGASAAAQMIRGFESFISTAKWDVNAFRTGFGSDTTTRANGTIEKVTKDTVVTLDDAERDLARRIVEFQSGIQRAIGVDTWRSLSDAQQAALTSIAYNYGSLPEEIVKAIQSGGGPEIVAQAIAGLTSNPKRRKQEAEAYLSGTGYSMADAGLSSKKSPSQIFAGDVADVQKRIDVLNAQYEAQSRLNPVVNDYGYAIEKAKIQQQLLAEAQKAGLTVTPELAASIETLAENYAKASSAGEMLKASQDRVRQSVEEFKGMSKDLVSGFISDLRNGASAADALTNALNKVLDKLIDISLNSIFGIGGAGGGGILGGLFSIFGLAKGGIVANNRPQPLKTFARGGVSNSAAIFGEAGPEAAVPLPDGRSIPVKFHEPSVPKRSSGQSSTFSPTYNIDARGADQAAVARLERGLAERDRTESKRVSGYNQRQHVRKTRP
ncbi:phage tail tape-measure protein [Rhizobium daejeonense]|uniref:Lysozyme n=1 Tax=Rhizobium daejeonense TaxID=240521 RepID=A0A6M1RXZ6_9HYPH|nr:phage tail length tape measure family protein [Rhizobium daejeonense]NGO63959.1 phage tail tape-measure protein [Rhizobium daejeonense]